MKRSRIEQWFQSYMTGRTNVHFVAAPMEKTCDASHVLSWRAVMRSLSRLPLGDRPTHFLRGHSPVGFRSWY